MYLVSCFLFSKFYCEQKGWVNMRNYTTIEQRWKKINKQNSCQILVAEAWQYLPIFHTR